MSAVLASFNLEFLSACFVPLMIMALIGFHFHWLREIRDKLSDILDELKRARPSVTTMSEHPPGGHHDSRPSLRCRTMTDRTRRRSGVDRFRRGDR